MHPKYLKMIRGMGKGLKREWSVYILRCGDDTLYTGITKNVETRVKRHGEGKGAAYTRTHLPVELVYRENSLTRSQALIRELRIKKLPRSAKEKLISKNETALQQAFRAV